MTDEERQVILQGAKEQQFAPGEIIFREGEPANALYLVDSGEVAIESTTDPKAIRIQTLAAGDVLGWSWLFPPFAWHFQARAIEATRVVCCDGGHLLVQAEENPVFGYALMRRITQLLIHRLQATRIKLAKAEAARPGNAGADRRD
jgi:CRP-like cAMP-binding protein